MRSPSLCDVGRLGVCLSSLVLPDFGVLSTPCPPHPDVHASNCLRSFAAIARGAGPHNRILSVSNGSKEEVTGRFSSGVFVM